MPKKRKVKLEWYVLNDTSCTGDVKIEPWNIFNNHYVNEKTLELCSKFKKDNLTFEEFKEEVRKTIMYEEWARCEYEILTTSWPSPHQFVEEKYNAGDTFKPRFEVARNVFYTEIHNGIAKSANPVIWINFGDDEWHEHLYGEYQLDGKIKHKKIIFHKPATVRYINGTYNSKFKKIDCYDQALMNLDALCKHVLDTYYPEGWK